MKFENLQTGSTKNDRILAKGQKGLRQVFMVKEQIQLDFQKKVLLPFEIFFSYSSLSFYVDNV